MYSKLPLEPSPAPQAAPTQALVPFVSSPEAVGKEKKKPSEASKSDLPDPISLLIAAKLGQDKHARNLTNSLSHYLSPEAKAKCSSALKLCPLFSNQEKEKQKRYEVLGGIMGADKNTLPQDSERMRILSQIGSTGTMNPMMITGMLQNFMGAKGQGSQGGGVNPMVSGMLQNLMSSKGQGSQGSGVNPMVSGMLQNLMGAKGQGSQGGANPMVSGMLQNLMGAKGLGSQGGANPMVSGMLQNLMGAKNQSAQGTDPYALIRMLLKR